MNNEYRRIIIENVMPNDTIYSYLRRNGFSETYTKKLRKQLGYIKLNEQNVFITNIIKNGDELQIFRNPNTTGCIQSCIIPLDIVYEDDYLLIVNKPSNIATIPTKSHYDYNLAGGITNYMEQKTNNFVCRVVNRLDKDTAGIVIVAKDSASAYFLSNKQNCFKTYYAVCEGNIKSSITINKNILTNIDENGIIKQKREVCDDNMQEDQGQTAITHVFPIKNYNGYCLVKVTLETGRTHQIRAHLSSIGHPLVGDTLYGNASEKIDHTALVCKAITFIHPVTKQLVNLEVNFPIDFNKLIK